MPKKQPPKIKEDPAPISPDDYHDMIMNAPIGVFSCTPGGRYVSVNSYMARMFGYDSPEEMIISITNLGARLYADPVCWEEITQSLDKKDERLDHECLFVRRDCSRFWASSNVRAVRNEEGKTIYYQGFLSDITERKKEQESLLRTQFAMDRAPDGILWIDDGGNIVYANDSACESRGYRRDELLTMKVFDLDPDFPSDNWEQHKERMQRRGKLIFECRHRRKNGSIFPIEVSTNHFDFGDNYLDCIFDRDITKRKQTEEVMNRRLAYESLLSCISAMAVAAEDREKFLDQSIALMGETANVSRTYLFEHCPETDRMDNRQEWCAAGVVSQKEKQQGLECRDMRWWVETLKSGNDICFNNVEDIPDETTRDKAQAMGILSIMAVPLSVKGIFYGFIGFDDYRQHRLWPEKDVELLLSISRIISIVIERKQYEEKLLRTQFAMDRAPDTILWVDDDGNIVYANDSACESRGYRRDELLTMKVFDIDPDFPADNWKHYKEEVRYRGNMTFESHHIRKDGTSFPVEISSNYFKFNDRFLICAFVRDISRRKEMEYSLKKREEQYHGLVNDMQDAVYRADLNGKILFANPSAAPILGCSSSEEIIGLTIGDDLYYYPKEAEKHIKRLKKEGKLTQCEVILKRRDNGEPVVVLTNTNLSRDRKGNITGVEGVCSDITKRKRAEAESEKLKEQLNRARKLESIGTLAGGIAHDFNNLLMGIQGHVSLMMLDLDQSDPHYMRLRKIEEQVKNGADLASNLLGFARGGRYEPKVMNINERLKITSAIFERAKSEIIVHEKLKKDLWLVEADGAQMDQVFMNLFVNAWQAMPAGGEIFLETCNLNIKSQEPHTPPPGKYVRITVRDTGMGMDALTCDRIFDPFFTTKGMKRGAGLGLAAVYGIIKGHGGTINLTSQPGQGTTFYIYLPTTDKAFFMGKSAATKTLDGKETILVVDDEERALDVATDMLQSMGYEVYGAADGPKAISLYCEKKTKIDLVILDMIMPGMNSDELFNRIREIDPNQRILFSSDYSIEVQDSEIIEKGYSGFLQKPFKIAELDRRVRYILDINKE